MEYLRLCSTVVLEEKTKFNLDKEEIIFCTAKLFGSNAFFERPYNRCAYMYKYAPCTLSFIKDCVKKFLTEYPKLTDLLLKWKLCPDLKFCSMSCGPGLDYLALLMALSETAEVPCIPFFKSVTIVSKSAQWRNTLNIMIDSIQEGCLKDFPATMLCDNFKVIQDCFASFSQRQRTAVIDADVLFMVKTMNISQPEPSETKKKYFQEMIAAMKTESLLFCIDTKPSVAIMAEVLNFESGEYLHEPFFNTIRLPENFPDFYKDMYGCLPVINARGCFFVWKKSSSYMPPFIPLLQSPTNNETKIEIAASLNEFDGTNSVPSLKVKEVISTDVLNSVSEKYITKTICDEQSGNLPYNEDSVFKQPHNCSEMCNPFESSLKLNNSPLNNCDIKSATNFNGNIHFNELFKETVLLYDQKKESIGQTETNNSKPQEQFDDSTLVNSMCIGNQTRADIEPVVRSVLTDVCDTARYCNLINKTSTTSSDENEFYDAYSSIKSETEKLVEIRCKHPTTILNDTPIINSFDDNTSLSEINLGENSAFMMFRKHLGSTDDSNSRSSISNNSDTSKSSCVTVSSKSLKSKQKKAKQLANSALINKPMQSSGNTSRTIETEIQFLSESYINCDSPIANLKNLPPDLLTGNQVGLNKNLELKKNEIENINRGAGSFNSNFSNYQSDCDGKKPKKKQSIGERPSTSAYKKSVEIGTDPDHQSEENFSIQVLTNRIKKLVSSFENVLMQNEEQNSGKINTGNCRLHPPYINSSPKRNIPFSGQPYQNYFSNFNCADDPINNSDDNSHIQSESVNKHISDSEIGACAQGQNVNQTCFSSRAHFNRHHCCSCMCGRMQMGAPQMYENNACCMMTACALHGCPHSARKNFPQCHACCGHGLHNRASPTVPNIVIPLQNISDDTIARIIAVLRAGSQPVQ